MTFEGLALRLHSSNLNWKPPEALLALDPGETTGWAHFLGLQLHDCGHLDTKTAPMSVARLIAQAAPTVVVVEDYKVYSWKAKQHSWSTLFTPKLIGIIQAVCYERRIKLYMQMANVAKTFCTDKRLKEWGFYYPGRKHARDAIRHGCYWLLFHKK